MSTFEKITETSEFLKKHNSSNAKIAVVLGSGLGNFVKEIVVQNEIPYTEIPHFPVSTVQGHSGKLIFGTIAGKPMPTASPPKTCTILYSACVSNVGPVTQK